MIIEIDENQMRDIRRALRNVPNGVNIAIFRGLKQALSTAKTQGAKLVGQELALKAARIKKDMHPEGPSVSNLSAALRVKSRPPGLMQFGAKAQRSGGVKYKLWRRGGAAHAPHAFIAPMKKGNVHVAQRARTMKRGYRARPAQPINYSQLPKSHRFKIAVLYGPRISSIFNEKKPEVERLASEAMARKIDTEAEKILRQNFG